MELAILIFQILLAIAVFLIGLFIKNYLPSYMDEKGKNLATKEDIAEITRKTEEVQKEFKEGFELFANDVKFKYDFYYKQYANLYCKLYAIVIQSEYVRHFIELQDKKTIAFNDVPFLEISPTHRETTTIHMSKENGSSMTHKTEDIETPISQFNKKELCDYIIENDSLASQKLLKLAVSYRFAYDYYSGNRNGGSIDVKDVADEEEFRMIKDIVITIVQDYNLLRKELKLNFNEEELNSGIPTL
jgi:hypothetical protein